MTGKLGGSVFQRTRGGYILRNNPVPTSPTAETVNISKAKFASIANAWAVDLTNAQRVNWEAYARTNNTYGYGIVTSKSKTGPTFAQQVRGGRLIFNSINRAIIDAGGTPILDPPPPGTEQQLRNPRLVISQVAQTLLLYFDNDTIDVPYVLSIRATQPYIPANMYASNNATFIGNFQPAVSPVDITALWTKAHGAWGIVMGTVIYSRPYIVHQGTGAISAPILLTSIVGP